MAPEFTLDPPDAGSLTGTTTSVGDDAPHSGQQSGGGGVEPDIRYLAAELEPGQDIARPWVFEDIPLLMLFDKTGDYSDLVGDGLPVQGRNAVADEMSLADVDERPNFPEDRSFNAVTLTLGQLTVTEFGVDAVPAPPRPGHEPDMGAIRDFPADGGAVAAVIDYAENRLESGVRLMVPLPERELLRAYLQGQKLVASHNFDWAKQPRADWLPHQTAIFGPIDTFISEILANASVREHLAGIKLSDEPDLLRRLSESFPEIVGLMAGRIEEDQEVAFRVVATERPFAWEWEFRQGGSIVVPVSGDGTFQPVVRFPNPGEATVRVRVGNWHAVTGWAEFKVTVLAALEVATPQITGLYTRTTGGVLRGRAKVASHAAIPLQWSPGGGDFGEPGVSRIGQAGHYGVCTVNGTAAVLSDLTGVDEALFPRFDWKFPATSLVTSLLDQPMETAAQRFPPCKLTDGNPDIITGCRVELLARQGFALPENPQEFTLEISSRPLDAPRGWIRPEFLQLVADRVHEQLLAASPGPERDVAIFMNFNGAVIEERFSPEAIRPAVPAMGEAPARPADFMKLRTNTDVDLIADRANEGARNERDWRTDRTFEVVAGQPLPPPPAAQFRMVRHQPQRRVVYSMDQYPIIGGDAQLQAKVVTAFPEVAEQTAAIIQAKIREQVDLRDPVQAIHAYARLLTDLAAPKVLASGEVQRAELKRNLFTFFWCQMWGYPFRIDGANSFDISGTPTLLLRDPESPAANDGWDLRKPTALEARFQAWMSILLGAEGVAWFSQHFIADALIFLQFNPIASEILRYADLRGNGRLLSKRGAAGHIIVGPLAGRAYLGWTNLSLPATDPDPMIGIGKDPQGNLRELISIGGIQKPVGRLEMGIACGALERINAVDITKPAGKQYLFLANPSFRQRTVQLDLTTMATQAAAGEVFQLYQLEAAVSGEQFAIAGKVDLNLAPCEVRIYEREVSA